MQKFWGRKTFLLVTGASKGIGQRCATEFSKLLGAGSLVIIAARTLPSLEPVKALILGEPNSSNLKLGMLAHNLEAPNGKILEQKATEFMEANSLEPSSFEHALFVHGAVTKFNVNAQTLDLHDPDDLQRFFVVNTLAPTIMNTHFLNLFREETKIMRTIVNITSVAAERPLRSMSTLCAATAARQMLMCCLAIENRSILVLNYDPEMLDIYVDGLKDCKEPEVQRICKDQLEKNQITTCDEAVSKLIKLLEKRQFFNGEHVKYWDLK